MRFFRQYLIHHADDLKIFWNNRFWITRPVVNPIRRRTTSLVMATLFSIQAAHDASAARDAARAAAAAASRVRVARRPAAASRSARSAAAAASRASIAVREALTYTDPEEKEERPPPSSFPACKPIPRSLSCSEEVAGLDAPSSLLVVQCREGRQGPGGQATINSLLLKLLTLLLHCDR